MKMRVLYIFAAVFALAAPVLADDKQDDGARARMQPEDVAENRREDFYRCLTEKLLIYALGRGLEYYDVAAVDEIVRKLEANDGKFSALLTGVIESAPFQKRRNVSVGTASGTKQESVALKD